MNAVLISRILEQLLYWGWPASFRDQKGICKRKTYQGQDSNIPLMEWWTMGCQRTSMKCQQLCYVELDGNNLCLKGSGFSAHTMGGLDIWSSLNLYRAETMPFSSSTSKTFARVPCSKITLIKYLLNDIRLGKIASFSEKIFKFKQRKIYFYL